MTRAAWMFFGSLGISVVACVRTTDHHDGGEELDLRAMQPTLDAGPNAVSPDDGASEVRPRDAGASDITPLMP
jgi:hypothetical protein